jgi:Uma2 family endonuclease
MMILTKDISTIPKTLEQFLQWEPNDGFKYEWNDGELIKFTGMKRKHLRLIQTLNILFDNTKAKKEKGQLICEQDVMVTGIQLRRPDLAYFTNEQIRSDENEEPIPEFCIEVISTFDQINGVKVVWLIMPDQDMVEIYTSTKDIKICTNSDICSAQPVLNDFEISVDELLK